MPDRVVDEVAERLPQPVTVDSPAQGHLGVDLDDDPELRSPADEAGHGLANECDDVDLGPDHRHAASISPRKHEEILGEARQAVGLF